MATIETYQRSALKKTNPLLTKLRTTVETAFYGSNMHEVTTLAEAYELAKTSPGVIVTDLPIKETAKLGLPEDAKVLVENGGKIVGRTAKARRIVGERRNTTRQPAMSDWMKSSSLKRTSPFRKATKIIYIPGC